LKELYTRGTEFAGLTYSFQNIITFLFAFAIPFIASKIKNKYTHMLCLFIGGAGLLSIQFISHGNVLMLYAVMGAVGIAWSSILSMPYSMLSGCLPEQKIGIYMGIFNFFIVLPEIIAALFFGPIMENVLHNNQIHAVMVGGGLLIVAGILTVRIKE
jgi:maltose/moltooligosaccharide transporter